MERFFLRWGVIIVVILLATGCVPDAALAVRATPPGYDIETAKYVSFPSVEGLQLGPLTLETHRRTAVVDGRQVTRLEIVEGEDVWYVACLLRVKTAEVHRVCSVDDGRDTAVVALHAHDRRPLSGRVMGSIELELEGLDQGHQMASTYTPTIVVHHDGASVGTVIPLRGATRIYLAPRASVEEARWLRMLGLMQAALVDPRDAGLGDQTRASAAAAFRPADAHKLRPRHDGDGTAGSSYLARLGSLTESLSARGRPKIAAQLSDLRTVEKNEVFDERAGPTDSPPLVTGMAAQVSAGVVWTPSPDGLPTDLTADGGRFDVSAGLRFHHRTTVMLGVGLQAPAFTYRRQGIRYEAPVGRYVSGTYDLSLAARHAIEPLFGSLEPVFGLALSTRLAFMRYHHPTVEFDTDAGEAASATYFGMGIAPIAGLQWAFSEHVAASRFILFWEVQPEFSVWPGRRTVDESDGSLPEAVRAVRLFEETGARSTMQWTTSFGMRFEL